VAIAGVEARVGDVAEVLARCPKGSPFVAALTGASRGVAANHVMREWWIDDERTLDHARRLLRR